MIFQKLINFNIILKKLIGKKLKAKIKANHDGRKQPSNITNFKLITKEEVDKKE